MTATIKTCLYTGAPTGTPNDLPATNLRFCVSDDYNPGNTYPIPIPGASYNYSYAKSIVFWVTGAPATSITSIYLYTDGTLGWGTAIYVKVANQFPATYVRSVGTPGTTGTEMTAGWYTGVTSASDFFGYTSAAPFGPITQIATSGTGCYTQFVVLQSWVGSGAASGAKTPETITWRYDEV